MSLIPDDVIEQVRDAADLVGIIGEHVELKRTGSDFRAPCPFHGGTHRNFAVIPRKGMFYCFVCHAGGDVFTFLMKKLGMDYCFVVDADEPVVFVDGGGALVSEAVDAADQGDDGGVSDASFGCLFGDGFHEFGVADL